MYGRTNLGNRSMNSIVYDAPDPAVVALQAEVALLTDKEQADAAAIAELEREVEELQLAQGDGSAAYIELSAEVDQLQLDQEADEAAISSLQTRVTNVEAQQATDGEAISSLQSRATADEARISSLETRATTDEADIAQLQVDVAALEEGAVQSLSIGLVETLAPGSAATAVVVQVGDTSEWQLSLGIPQGEKGEKGDTGATGPKGDKGNTGEKGEKGDTGDSSAAMALAITADAAAAAAVAAAAGAVAKALAADATAAGAATAAAEAAAVANEAKSKTLGIVSSDYFHTLFRGEVQMKADFDPDPLLTLDDSGNISAKKLAAEKVDVTTRLKVADGGKLECAVIKSTGPHPAPVVENSLKPRQNLLTIEGDTTCQGLLDVTGDVELSSTSTLFVSDIRGVNTIDDSLPTSLELTARELNLSRFVGSVITIGGPLSHVSIPSLGLFPRIGPAPSGLFQWDA